MGGWQQKPSGEGHQTRPGASCEPKRLDSCREDNREPQLQKVLDLPVPSSSKLCNLR